MRPGAMRRHPGGGGGLAPWGGCVTDTTTTGGTALRINRATTRRTRAGRWAGEEEENAMAAHRAILAVGAAAIAAEHAMAQSLAFQPLLVPTSLPIRGSTGTRDPLPRGAARIGAPRGPRACRLGPRPESRRRAVIPRWRPAPCPKRRPESRSGFGGFTTRWWRRAPRSGGCSDGVRTSVRTGR